MIINGRTKYIPKAPTKNVGNESLTPAPLWTKYIYIYKLLYENYG